MSCDKMVKGQSEFEISGIPRNILQYDILNKINVGTALILIREICKLGDRNGPIIGS